MKLVYIPAPQQHHWVAKTDDGNNDGSGETPMLAVCALVAQIEAERCRERSDG
jgi:hypothetical protein